MSDQNVKNTLNPSDSKYENLFETLNSKEDSWAVILQNTTKLQKGQLPRLENLYKLSHESSSAINRYICTFLNSVLHHKRFYFVLNRDLFAEMVREDKNHPPKHRTFNNRLFSKLFVNLVQTNIIVVREESGKKFLEVVDDWLKQQLVLELSQEEIKKIHEAQRKQTIDFIKFQAKSSVPDVNILDTNYDAVSEASYLTKDGLFEQVGIFEKSGKMRQANALREEFRRGNYKK